VRRPLHVDRDRVGHGGDAVRAHAVEHVHEAVDVSRPQKRRQALDALGIATRSGRPWHPQQVARILK
jgi:hypothetical protein